MKKQLLKITMTVLLTGYCPHSPADVSGKLIAFGCYSCHGEKLTRLNLHVPLSKIKLTQTLLAFKSKQKKSTIMQRITKGYTDSELAAVATYLSELN